MALLKLATMNIFTLPLSIAFPTPTHDGVMVLGQCSFVQQLGEHVCWLIKGVDCMQRNLSMVNIVSEMVVLDIDVLGSWVHLWDFGNFKGTTVVFKDSAVDCGLSGDHLETLFLEFFHKLHEWNCGTKGGQQTNELALCGAEGNLHLEWDAQMIGQPAYMPM